MNVKKKGSQQLGKGRRIKPKRLRTLFFSIQFFSQASTPSLRGPATQPLHNEGRSPELNVPSALAPPLEVCNSMKSWKSGGYNPRACTPSGSV